MTGRREKNKKSNRELIIKSGIDVFLEKGINQATVRDIIRKTNLASGTFYNYFKSKEEVLIAALDDAAVEIGQVMRDQRKKAKNLEEFVLFQIEPFLKFAKEHSSIFLILNSNLNMVESFSIETPMMTLELRYLREDVIAGIEQGILPNIDVDYFCTSIQSVAEGVARTFISKKDSKADIDLAIKFCTNFIVSGVKSTQNV